MTLYNHCGIPLEENDERKPAFVSYEDYMKAIKEAEQCRRELTEIIGRLYMAAID